MTTIGKSPSLAPLIVILPMAAVPTTIVKAAAEMIPVAAPLSREKPNVRAPAMKIAGPLGKNLAPMEKRGFAIPLSVGPVVKAARAPSIPSPASYRQWIENSISSYS